MKLFRFTAALSLALALLPVGTASADDEAKPLPLPDITMDTEVSKVAEETDPVVDLVFCVDVSGSMQGYMPVVKATILSLIQRTTNKYPGHTVRLGLIRYGDENKRYFVLDLSEDQQRFLKHLQDTKSDAVASEFVGDVIKKSAEELTWSKNAAAHRLYVIGNESALQGPVSIEDAIKAAREKSVTVSAAYCSFPGGRSQGSNLKDVQTWFGREWDVKQTWVDVARRGGGEYMQIVSQGGSILPGSQPLVAVAWEPTMALRFAAYLSGPASQAQMTVEQIQINADRIRTQRGLQSLGVSKISFPTDPLEAGVTRYYDLNPKDATYLIRF